MANNRLFLEKTNYVGETEYICIAKHNGEEWYMIKDTDEINKWFDEEYIGEDDLKAYFEND